MSRIARAASSSRVSRAMTSSCGNRVWSMISTAGWSGVESGASQTGRIGWPVTVIVVALALFHDKPRGRAAHRGLAGDFFPHARGDVAEGLSVGRVRLRHGDRAAFVGGLADRQIEWYLAEKIGAEPGGLAASAAVGEDVAALAAMRAQEIAHILYDAEHRYVDLLEHRQALASVD